MNPIELAPNPTVCTWKGPLVSDLICNQCALGYETTSPTNATCVKPESFRPHKAWPSSPEKARLKIFNMHNVAVDGPKDGFGESVPELLTGQEYTVPAPSLEPKEQKFAGYAQPYTKIRYELDWTQGAEVDVGCGTAVVGDATITPMHTSKSMFTDPMSQYKWQYQWPYCFGKEDACFPCTCVRYHRFEVTEVGNITFDACSSTMNVGIKLYKRTDNLSESATGMLANWTWSTSGKMYEVPIHIDDRLDRYVSTGLTLIQPDIFPPATIQFVNDNFGQSSDFPRLVTSPFQALNGCPLGQSVRSQPRMVDSVSSNAMSTGAQPP